MKSQKILNSLRIGITALALGLAQMMNAQTYNTASTTTPGTPTTALGGLALVNVSIIAFSLSLIAMGVMLARRARKIS